jgi:hypothetical protein
LASSLPTKGLSSDRPFSFLIPASSVGQKTGTLPNFLEQKAQKRKRIRGPGFFDQESDVSFTAAKIEKILACSYYFRCHTTCVIIYSAVSCNQKRKTIVLFYEHRGKKELAGPGNCSMK